MSNEVVASILPPQWSLPKAITRRVGETVGRQRAMIADGHLLLLLHGVPDPEAPEREGVLIWRNPDDRWTGTGRGSGAGLLRKHLAAYDAAVDAVEALADTADSADDWFAVLKVIGPLKRAARNLSATLQSAREALPDVRALIVSRDQAVDIERAAEIAHEEAEQGLRFALAQQAEEQAAAAQEMALAGHRLNGLVAVFLPLTAVSGLFGMNLPNGIDAKAWMFWTVLGLSLGFGLFVRSRVAHGRRPTG